MDLRLDVDVVIVIIFVEVDLHIRHKGLDLARGQQGEK
jgi:hypothetical protein